MSHVHATVFEPSGLDATSEEYDDQIGARNVAPSWMSISLFALGLVMVFCAVAVISVNAGA
ncbi:MAG: hypothetical protein U0Q15_02135 [Kineosporiaceae bacterium]